MIRKVICGKSSFVVKGYACSENTLRAEIHYWLSRGGLSLELLDVKQRGYSDCAGICSFEILGRLLLFFSILGILTIFHYLKVSVQI